jgi:hypothetical protein
MDSGGMTMGAQDELAIDLLAVRGLPVLPRACRRPAGAEPAAEAAPVGERAEAGQDRRAASPE